MGTSKFSPKKYLQENGRKLPVERCLIADGYSRKGLTICLIVKKQPGGKYTFAKSTFLIPIWLMMELIILKWDGMANHFI